MRIKNHGVNNPDTMYHHQAMKQPDKEKFKEAMQKEGEAHYKEGNYKLIKRDELPKGATCEYTPGIYSVCT